MKYITEQIKTLLYLHKPLSHLTVSQSNTYWKKLCPYTPGQGNYQYKAQGTYGIVLIYTDPGTRASVAFKLEKLVQQFISFDIALDDTQLKELLMEPVAQMQRDMHNGSP